MNFSIIFGTHLQKITVNFADLHKIKRSPFVQPIRSNSNALQKGALQPSFNESVLP